MAMTARRSDPTALVPHVRVVIADDDLDQRALLTGWLGQHGAFDVALEAADGLQAVAAAQRIRPDLAVLDLAMPRMDGLEAATAIRRLLPDTRIVVRSGFSAERMAQRAIDAGADVYVEKGVPKAELLDVLEELFASPAANRHDAVPEGAPPSQPSPGSVGGSLDDHLLLDALDAAVVIVDPAGRVTSANLPATSALGVPAGRLVGSSFTDLLSGARDEAGREVGSDVPDPVATTLASGVPQPGQVLRLRRAEGGFSSRLLIKARAIPDAAGSGLVGAIVVLTDVTEERRLREALQDAEARLALVQRRDGSVLTNLLEAAVISSPVGAVLFDASARLVIANPVADRLVGGSALLGVDPPTRDLCWADTKKPVAYEDLPLRAACEGTPFDDLELFVADVAGQPGGTYLRISGRPVLGERGERAGAVISVLDDTASKEAEQELTSSQADLRRSNSELANFASVASHDLAQPLQKIYGFAQLLQDGDLEDAQAQDYIDRVVLGCERMNALIQDLLTYSRLTSDARQFEPVDLMPVVAEVLELFDQEVDRLDARIEVDPLPTVVADRVQMRQLFQNLTSNALTYVRRGVPPVIAIRSARAGGEWRVTVVDNGIGIRPEDRQRAFAMFQRLVSSDDYPGTGIGLAVCAKIIERHGGRIWIEGNPSGGSSVSFTLPDRPRRRGFGGVDPG